MKSSSSSGLLDLVLACLCFAMLLYTIKSALGIDLVVGMHAWEVVGSLFNLLDF
ncbi:hypothetical protein [Gloeobacter kilaueensis]|uniref:Uncharacterized protein n=1 Tax=Gloeobacter kilaueensis (strain ATCC BAA-2537 / CCAP 1431/1 / ULC 316 / JS1) TaxID=1183438 RepID=U5QLI5_GLOK1|nr:hypothetical protein [Gloeobacter kilaueensis]AGY58540.1 hypothetical protein GKIL_2294 [Gloeobacter kilaueensis JS1]